MPFTITTRPFDHPDTTAMIGRIQEYYRDLYGNSDNDPTDAEDFTPPSGLFLVGYLTGRPVACGAWRRRDAVSVEIKRMYVDPEQQRQGFARRLLAELERTASAAGARRIVLNTGYRQTAALAFYSAHGYVPTDERYGYYQGFTGAHFFIKEVPAHGV